jgi:hypothetical protein
LNADLNPICHLLALLGAHHILHVSGIRIDLGEEDISHLKKRIFGTDFTVATITN